MGFSGLIMVLVLMGIIEDCISELRPGAQIYIPSTQTTPQKTPIKVPCTSSSQSSRYSRKTVRAAGETPRPILGTKAPFPRAILGRKEFSCENHEERKDLRALSRNMQQKISEEKLTPMKANSCSL